MSELERLNQFFNQIIGAEYDKLLHSKADPKRKFPNGFKYRYFNAGKGHYLNQWLFCYSTTRNANGKFVSWTYKWDTKHKKAEFDNLVEFARRNKAKARALRMYHDRKLKVQESLQKKTITNTEVEK